MTAGGSGHASERVPVTTTAHMLYAIFERGAWADYRKPLEVAWRPYIDGGRTLPEAAAGLIESVRKTNSTLRASP